MGIRFACPNGHKLNVKEELAGKKALCPSCGARIVIPPSDQPPQFDQGSPQAESAAGLPKLVLPSTALPPESRVVPLVREVAGESGPPVAVPLTTPPSVSPPLTAGIETEEPPPVTDAPTTTNTAPVIQYMTHRRRRRQTQMTVAIVLLLAVVVLAVVLVFVLQRGAETTSQGALDSASAISTERSIGRADITAIKRLPKSQQVPA